MLDNNDDNDDDDNNEKNKDDDLDDDNDKAACVCEMAKTKRSGFLSVTQAPRKQSFRVTPSVPHIPDSA